MPHSHTSYLFHNFCNFDVHISYIKMQELYPPLQNQYLDHILGMRYCNQRIQSKINTFGHCYNLLKVCVKLLIDKYCKLFENEIKIK